MYCGNWCSFALISYVVYTNCKYFFPLYFSFIYLLAAEQLGVDGSFCWWCRHTKSSCLCDDINANARYYFYFLLFFDHDVQCANESVLFQWWYYWMMNEVADVSRGMHQSIFIKLGFGLLIPSTARKVVCRLLKFSLCEAGLQWEKSDCSSFAHNLTAKSCVPWLGFLFVKRNC